MTNSKSYYIFFTYPNTKVRRETNREVESKTERDRAREKCMREKDTWESEK
jgi:hypothetical protein